jgi:hypothetical protein
MIAPNVCGGKGFADGAVAAGKTRTGIDDRAMITASLNDS